MVILQRLLAKTSPYSPKTFDLSRGVGPLDKGLKEEGNAIIELKLASEGGKVDVLASNGDVGVWGRRPRARGFHLDFEA